MKLVLSILIFVLFASTSFAKETTLSFNEYEFLDKKLIFDSKVSELKLIISKHKKGEEPDESHACIVYTSKFDLKGNLIRYSLDRVGSHHYYRYDDKGGLTDWGWADKSSGEVVSIAEDIKVNGDDYEAQRLETETRLNSMLDSRKDYRSVVVRAIRDTCYSIEANYQITHKDTGDLPKEAIAEHVSEIGEMIRDKIHKSADKLYIYYDYQFHQ